MRTGREEVRGGHRCFHGRFDRALRLILFMLDESAYARELAPLADHYPALRLGPP